MRIDLLKPSQAFVEYSGLMTGALAAAYHSGAQCVRVVTESWGESNLYCPNCSSPKLTWLESGHPASDYFINIIPSTKSDLICLAIPCESV
jgi:hypothetical protein